MAEQLKTPEDIREAVRERYAAAAGTSSCGTSCCGPGEQEVFGAGQYAAAERNALPTEATLASLGCGNPTAVAELQEGEVVLDLGSGGGIDVPLTAQRVGPAGKAYGLDMTGEMLALARRNARQAGVYNAEFLEGVIEEIPLPDESVDVVISNCVINLSADKPQVLREAARVLRPGGRLAVTDIVADADMDSTTRRDMEQWAGCIAGSLTAEEFRRGLEAAGFVDVELRETHRVHAQAGSAIVRGRKKSR